MRLLLALAAFLPLAMTHASARPTDITELEPRTPAKPKCPDGQYYWFRLSICVPYGGVQIGVTPPGVSCPTSWNWRDKKKCCVPTEPHHDPPGTQPTCPPGHGKWDKKRVCCHQPPPPPQPSKGYGHGHGGGHHSGGGYHNGGGGHHKGSYDQGHKGGKGKGRPYHRTVSPVRRSVLPLDGRVDAGRWPKGLTACPATSAGIDDDEWECLDPTEELTSCGGCASLGQGQNCLLIPSAVSLTCNLGACEVHSCRPGFTPFNGSTCVPIASPYGSPDSQVTL